MGRRVLFTTVGVLAAVVLGIAAVGYVRSPESRLTAPARTSSGPPLQLIKNAAVVATFEARDLDGGRIASDLWRDKVTLVNFWATWCAPCRAEIPDLIALQEKYRDRLQIVGVSVDEAPAEAVRAFAQAHRINYPVVMATHEITRAFPGVFALPTTFVLDQLGRVVQKHVGLVNVGVYEHAARVLSGLDDHAIEEVEDSRQTLLANAAQATELPGLDLTPLAPAARRQALQRLNADGCPCGCALTLAQCRINDPSCSVSLPIAQALVKTLAAER
jgi:thiol-disulfide isomerase/thioredoxin